MRAYEQIPHALLFDCNLSPSARTLYPVLRHLAWKSGRRRSADAVELPPLREIAETLGVSESALKGYMAELRRRGWLETVRGARNRPLLYVLFDEPCEAESGSRVRRNPAHYARAGVQRKTSDLQTTERADALSGERPPPWKLQNGRNPAFDVLAAECSADHDARGSEIGSALAQIRKLYWRDLPDRTRGLLADPDSFSDALMEEIRRKARLYESRMHGALLTPSALAKWWADLERLPGGNLSGPEAQRVAEEEEARMRAEAETVEGEVVGEEDES